MRGLSNVLSLFRNEFDQFNNTGARMFDSVYHVMLKLFCYRMLGVKMHSFTQRYNGRHSVTLLICKPLVVYRFYCMSLYHLQTQRHLIIYFTVLIFAIKPAVDKLLPLPFGGRFNLFNRCVLFNFLPITKTKKTNQNVVISIVQIVHLSVVIIIRKIWTNTL